MNISWVLANAAVVDPTQDIDQLKGIGAFWGSWQTWRAYQTDNVICHNQVKVAELIKREFQKRCNFYMPESVYNNLDRPSGVNIYAGDFVHDVDNQDEIVAMHLAATTSDIVLLLGFDLSELNLATDKLNANRAQHHRNLIKQAFITYSDIQWVIVDHTTELDQTFTKLDNVVTDSMDAVLSLAGD